MRKVSILVMAMVLVVGMSFGVIADDGADAEVDQIGNNNTVKANQSADERTNMIDVIQDGDLNEVFINQGGLTGTVVSQFGDENLVDVDVGGNQYTEIEQDGNNNDAIVEAPILGDSSWEGSTDYKGTQLVQRGNNNEFSAEVYISQSFSKQIGNRNYIDLSQPQSDITMFAKAFMNQEGDDNYIELTQLGARDGAYMLQRGDDNVARLEQDGGSEFASEDKETTQFYKQDSESTFAQIGDDNRLAGVDESGNLDKYGTAVQVNSEFMGYQDGNNNVIGLSQGGNDDGLITQNGNRNEALLYQGDELSHTAEIIQNGNANDAEVIQK